MAEGFRGHGAGAACLRGFEMVEWRGPAFARLRHGKHVGARREGHGSTESRPTGAEGKRLELAKAGAALRGLSALPGERRGQVVVAALMCGLRSPFEGLSWFGIGNPGRRSRTRFALGYCRSPRWGWGRFASSKRRPTFGRFRRGDADGGGREVRTTVSWPAERADRVPRNDRRRAAEWPPCLSQPTRDWRMGAS